MYAFEGHSEIESIGWYMIWKHVEYVRYKRKLLTTATTNKIMQQTSLQVEFITDLCAGKKIQHQFVCKQKIQTNLCASGWTVTAAGWIIVLLINILHTQRVSWKIYKTYQKRTLKDFWKQFPPVPAVVLHGSFPSLEKTGWIYGRKYKLIRWTHLPLPLSLSLPFCRIVFIKWAVPAVVVIIVVVLFDKTNHTCWCCYHCIVDKIIRTCPCGCCRRCIVW